MHSSNIPLSRTVRWRFTLRRLGRAVEGLGTVSVSLLRVNLSDDKNESAPLEVATGALMAVGAPDGHDGATGVLELMGVGAPDGHDGATGVLELMGVGAPDGHDGATEGAR